MKAAYEPTDEECEWKADEEEELTVSKQVQVKFKHLHASWLTEFVTFCLHFMHV